MEWKRENEEVVEWRGELNWEGDRKKRSVAAATAKKSEIRDKIQT